jgi:hypothetical protein
MSGIQYQTSYQTNQAVALLGGSTAQSYRTVSLNASPAAFDVLNTAASLPTSDLPNKSPRAEGDANTQALERLIVDTSVQLVPVRLSALNIPEELSELPVSLAEPDTQNAELISRFQSISQEDESSTGVLQTVLTGNSVGTDEVQESIATAGTGFSLLDFIEQTIAQAEASQQEFETTFDGSRQGEVRELLIDAGMELDSGVRGFLQDNIAGATRGVLSSAIDATGVELLDSIAGPALSIDFYAKSAEMLNGLIDTVAQPIGSIALPQAGPLLASPREELAAYLG